MVLTIKLNPPRHAYAFEILLKPVFDELTSVVHPVTKISVGFSLSNVVCAHNNSGCLNGIEKFPLLVISRKFISSKFGVNLDLRVFELIAAEPELKSYF